MIISKVISRIFLFYFLNEISASYYRPDIDFDDLVKSPYFIDKTLLIKTYFDNLKTVNHTLITCPRKFGKTANLKMMKFFTQLEVNESKMAIDPEHTKAYQVFKNLRIGQHEDIIKAHLAQYPVLYLDLGNVLFNASNPQEIFVNLRRQISLCCREYLYVYEHLRHSNSAKKVPSCVGRKKLLYYVDRLMYGKPTRGELRKCLLRMAELLYLYFKRRIIILVDDLSGVITDTQLFRVFLEREMFRFMVPGMLKDFYRFNFTFAHSAMITGHSSIGLPSYFYGFVKFRHYHFLENHPYSEYYGFTQHQTQVLFDRFEVSKQNRTRFKNYYQGYVTRNSSLTLYNPYWVIEYLQTNQYVLLSPELVQYDDVEAPENLYLYCFMHNNEFRPKIIELIEYKAAIDLKKQYDPADRKHFIFYKTCKRFVGTFPVPLMFTYIFERGYLTHTIDGNVFTVTNVPARRPLLQMMFLYYSQNSKLFDAVKEGMHYVLRTSARSTPNNLRQMKFWFDQNILNTMLKQKHQSLEDEFHAMLLASVVPKGNVLNDYRLQLKTDYKNRTCVHRPNIVVVNREESFASVLIVRFNSTLSVSQIIQQAKNQSFYDDRGIRSKKIMVIRINQKHETTVDEKIDETVS